MPTSLLAVWDQRTMQDWKYVQRHTHHCGLSVRQAPRTHNMKNNTTPVEFKCHFVLTMRLYCFPWASFYHSPHKIWLENFFLPLEHTHVHFFAGISSTESLAVCGNFTSVKKIFLPLKKKKTHLRFWSNIFWDSGICKMQWGTAM